jgi:hypothetical protein
MQEVTNVCLVFIGQNNSHNPPLFELQDPQNIWDPSHPPKLGPFIHGQSFLTPKKWLPNPYLKNKV